MPRNSGTPYERIFDSITTLSYLAAITSRVKLGISSLITAMRNPVVVAKQLATIDNLSDGMIMLATSVGWNEKEFAHLGSNFHNRGKRLDASIRLIRALWRGETSFKSRVLGIEFNDAVFEPRPAQKHLAIWIGGTSKAAMKRAATLGDAWHPIRVRLPWLRDTGLPRLREIADKEGRPLPALCPRIRLRITEAKLADDQRIAGEGSLDQIRSDLEALAKLGASHVLLDTYTDDAEATRHHEAAWRMLVTLAERVVDLPKESLR